MMKQEAQRKLTSLSIFPAIVFLAVTATVQAQDTESPASLYLQQSQELLKELERAQETLEKMGMDQGSSTPAKPAIDTQGLGNLLQSMTAEIKPDTDKTDEVTSAPQETAPTVNNDSDPNQTSRGTLSAKRRNELLHEAADFLTTRKCRHAFAWYLDRTRSTNNTVFAMSNEGSGMLATCKAFQSDDTLEYARTQVLSRCEKVRQSNWLKRKSPECRILHANNVLLMKPSDMNLEIRPRNLQFAVERLDLATVEGMLRDGADPDEIADIDTPPVIIAAQERDIDKLAALLEYGADINARTRGFGFSALISASMINAGPVVEFLLEKGADPEARGNGARNTAMHLAAQRGYTDIIDLLLAAGVDVDIRTKIDNTPLHLAAQNDKFDAIGHLLTLGASLNARNVRGETPLDYAIQGAARRASAETIAWMKAQGAKTREELE